MFVFTCLIVCVTLIWVWRNRKFIKLHRQIGVQYPALPLIGHAYMFVGDGQAKLSTFNTLSDIAMKLNGIVSLWLGDRFSLIVVDAEAAELVLANCLEKDEFNLFFRKLLGSGSIMAPVSVWRPRRKHMAPFFGITNANRSQDSLLKHSDNLVKHLESMADTEPFSMFDVFYPYAFDTIMELILGLTLNSHEEEDTRVLKAVPDCFNSVAYFLFQPYLQFEIIYTRLPIWAKFLNDKQNIQRLIAKVMASKQKLYDGKNNNVDANISLKSLVDFLYSSPDDKKLSIDEIREELFVMLFGSTILPCVSLCFTCMMLAKYPDVQEKLIRELDEESSRYEKGLTKSRPHENKYLEAVIKETFRLYPSVPTVSRKIDKDIEMPSGTVLPAGAACFISIWGIHRNPKYWGPDADSFRPERFFDRPPKHPASLMPFSYKSRGCIGMHFGMLSLKVILASLLKEYRFLPNTTTDAPVRPLYDIILKDADNYMIRLKRRDRIQQ